MEAEYTASRTQDEALARMLSMQRAYGFIQTDDISSILALVHGWVRLLAQRDFTAAADYLTPVPGARVSYTADVIEGAIGRYSRLYREASEAEKQAFLPVVSDPSLIDRSGEQMVIHTNTSAGVAFIEYAMPIDGEWSELTATFFLLSVEGGFGLGLHDLHVH